MIIVYKMNLKANLTFSLIYHFLKFSPNEISFLKQQKSHLIGWLL
ncbi:hypothetical protein D8856_05085 [Streptococcus mitis]|uniref:Uncharacterized protein n=1 Tax=Streptococcus mitis TaxID=28037 RepID=A0A3R9J2N7_STRMT|nr:hypothetical protein D8856_05085 [Streptococcus mitis]